jgi:hypothetical protein
MNRRVWTDDCSTARRCGGGRATASSGKPRFFLLCSLISGWCRQNELAMDSGMNRARAIVAIISLLAISLASQAATAQRGDAIDTLAAQMNEAARSGREAEGLSLAQRLEGLVRRRQGTDNLNY